MLGAAGQEGSLFELVQHTRIRIQIQIPEPPIDRNELVQCQAKCRAKKKKDEKSNSQRMEKAKHEPRWFAASVAQVLHSENAKENCWLKGVKKKGVEWGEGNAKTLKTMSVSCSRPHLTLFLLHQLRKSTSFVEKQQRQRQRKHYPLRSYNAYAAWYVRQQVKLKYLMKRLMCNFPSSPQL